MLMDEAQPPSADQVAAVNALPHQQNPCVARFGPGPAGQRCGGCLHLRGEHDVTGYTVYYCSYVHEHRQVTAPSCARYEPAPLCLAPWEQP